MNQPPGDLPLVAGDVAGGKGGDAKLLLQFAGQRLRLALAGFHLSAGKLPHSRLVSVRRTLCKQNIAILLNNGGDNINGF